MAKRKRTNTKAKTPVRRSSRIKKPTRKSRRLQKLAPVCNGRFCSDPGCQHRNKDKANPGSKKALKQFQTRAISTKQPVKRLKHKPVYCKRKTNLAKRPLTDYNRFVQHVSKNCRDAGQKQTAKFKYVNQAASCWKKLSPQQRELFKSGGTKDTQIFKAGPPQGSPPPPRPAPENPPQPAAPQGPPNPGTRSSAGPPYFLHGNFTF